MTAMVTPAPTFAMAFVLLVILLGVVAVGVVLVAVPRLRKFAALLIPLLCLPFLLYLMKVRTVSRSYEVGAVEWTTTMPDEQTSGQIIGGGDRWNLEYERLNIADRYSSNLEALDNLAFRCGASIQQASSLALDAAEANPEIYFVLSGVVDETSGLEQAFALSLKDATGLEVVNSRNSQDDIQIHVREQPGKQRSSKELIVMLTMDGLEQEFSAEYQPEKSWVRNSDAFKTSSDAPRQYFVAHGQDGREAKSAIYFAAEHLAPLVASALNSNSNALRRRPRPDTLMQISDDVARRLIVDTFHQSFQSDIVGRKLDRSERREAILVDYSPTQFNHAFLSAVQDYNRPNSSRHHPEMLTLMGFVVLGIFGLLFGISKYFDRRWPVVMQTA